MTPAQFIRENAFRLYDAWKEAACPGTWADYLATAIPPDTTIFIVALGSVPVRAFYDEEEAQYYIDHHDHPEQCAITDVHLKDDHKEQLRVRMVLTPDSKSYGPITRAMVDRWRMDRIFVATPDFGLAVVNDCTWTLRNGALIVEGALSMEESGDGPNTVAQASIRPLLRQALVEYLRERGEVESPDAPDECQNAWYAYRDVAVTVLIE